jgi:predicted nucleic acid-binding protein
VVDASAVVNYGLAAEAEPRLAGVIESREVRLQAPALCDVEVVSALRRLLARGEISAARATELLDDHLGLRVVRHGHRPLVRRALELRDNFTASNATYVALAEALGAPLLTADSRLARAVREHSGIELAA